MTEYIVRYTLHNHVYESMVYTSSSSSAMYWVTNLFPDATNISCLETKTQNPWIEPKLQN